MFEFIRTTKLKFLFTLASYKWSVDNYDFEYKDFMCKCCKIDVFVTVQLKQSVHYNMLQMMYN